jgi:hypothetical protein
MAHVVHDADDRVALRRVGAADATRAAERAAPAKYCCSNARLTIIDSGARMSSLDVKVRPSRACSPSSRNSPASRFASRPAALIRRRRVAFDSETPIAHLRRERKQSHRRDRFTPGNDATRRWSSSQNAATRTESG